MKKTWQETSRVFDERAGEYDRWFDNSLLYAIELAALKQAVAGTPQPRVEAGVGPGRFAAELAFDIGIDPAPAPLRIAAQRGLAVIRGTGERLPLQTETVGTVSLLFTLCFLSDPEAVFAECKRVLRDDGRLILGFIPADSSWGSALREKKKNGHPFYVHADFKTVSETTGMLERSGFQVKAGWSTLRQPPGELNILEQPQSGMDERAGFCVLRAGKQSSTS